MKTLCIIAGANGSGKTTFAKSFIIETTLSGKYLINYIKKAQSLGYQVSLIIKLGNHNVVKLDILRVKNRVLNGGHYIPKDDIIRRYHRSKSMFYNTYKDLVDDWNVYYNTNDIFEEIANKDVILDSEKYNELIKDLDANDR